MPWGIFGGHEGQCGALQIYNAARPDDITDMPAKFAGLRVSSGDVMAFHGPCGGGHGDPLERPAEKVGALVVCSNPPFLHLSVPCVRST